MKNIILASTSPRRKELLKLLNISFTTAASNVDELKIRHSVPEKLVAMLAEAKAREVAKGYSDALIIGSDTIIELDGKIIEKANSKTEQKELIYEQLGKTTCVITAVTFIDTRQNRVMTRLKKTECEVARPTDQKVKEYIESGQGLDKGGGFGFQDEDGMFIEKITGCYTNSIGFPLCTVSEMLNEFGIESDDPKNRVRAVMGKTC